MESYRTRNYGKFLDKISYWSAKLLVGCIESFGICNSNSYVVIDHIELIFANKGYDLTF